MGKSSSAKMSVVDYRMSVFFGFCNAADRIRRILINDKEAWNGNVTAATAINVNQPNLFGGEKKEGGAVGTVHFLPGKPTQIMPENLANKLGVTADTCPGFRGKTTLFFHGGSQGFLWSQNSPIVAQSVGAELERAPLGLDPSLVWVDGYSVNPAHVIYECYIDRVWGCGMSTLEIDTAAFTAAAQTLKNEGMGVSMFWNQQSKVEDFVADVLAHIQGVIFTDQTTGLLTLKLIRDDYDVGSLTVLNALNARVTSVTDVLWGDTINEITVSWTNPATEETQTVTMQDLANIAIQGSTKPDTRNYYGFRNETLALAACARDLRLVAAPIKKIAIEADRTAWNFRPGSVFIANFPEQKLSNVVCRISEITYGKKGDSKITIACATDVFSLDHPQITTPQSSVWVDPSILPTPLDDLLILSLPYYFASSNDLQSSAIVLEYPETLALILGFSADQDTVNYDLLSRALQPNGSLAYNEAGSKTLVDRVTLPGTLSRTANSIPASIGGRPDRGPRIGGFMLIGTLDAASELLHITDIDGSGNWVVQRGVLDTVPADWSAGTKVWFINPGTRLVDDATLRADGETAHYKMLPRTSRGRLAESAATDEPATLEARAFFPTRPANVQINGQPWSAVNVSSVSNISITWATRNRLFEDGQILNWTDAGHAGEYGQHTVVQVFDPSNTLVWEYQGLYTESGLTVPKTHFARWASVTIKVISRRDGIDSLQGYALQVTGLANNPAAALPPTPPALGVPPSPTLSPVAGDYTLTNGPVASTGGIKQPCVTVTGTVHSGVATGLLIRYRPNVLIVDWRYHGVVSVTDGQPVRVDIMAVAPETTYAVEIAYAAEGTYDSNWVSLGTATSGELKAGDVTSIGGMDPVDLVNSLNTSLVETLRNNLDLQTFKQAQEALNYVGDGSSTQLNALTAKSLSQTAMSLLNLFVAVNGTGSAVVMDLTKVLVDPSTSLATKFSSITSSLNGLTSSVTAVANAIDGVTADYTLSVNGAGGVVGLLAKSGPNVNYFMVVSENFLVYDPSNPSSPKQLLSMTGSKARFTTNVEIDGNLTLTGTIKTRTLDINAAVVPFYASMTDQVACATDNLTLTIDLPYDGWVNVTGGAHFICDTHHGDDIRMYIVCEGQELEVFDDNSLFLPTRFAPVQGSISLNAGTHVIHMNNVADSRVQVKERQLIAYYFPRTA